MLISPTEKKSKAGSTSPENQQNLRYARDLRMQPRFDADERIFTLADVQKLFRSQRKKIFRAALCGGAAVFCYFAYTHIPTYQFNATFKEGASKGVSGGSSGELQKLVGAFSGGTPIESQAIALIQSQLVLTPLVQQMGLQAFIPNAGTFVNAYRQIKENLLSEMGKPLSDIDWFAFCNVVYDGERSLKFRLRFDTPEKFSIFSGNDWIAAGDIGSEVRLSDVQFTILKAPIQLQLGRFYPLLIQPLNAVMNGIRANLQVMSSKQNASIYFLKFFHRDRRFGVNFLNALMATYRSYLKAEHDEIAKAQLAYLQQRQEEISLSLMQAVDEYAGFLKETFDLSGCLVLNQQVENVSNIVLSMSNKIRNIDMELDQLTMIEADQKMVVPCIESPWFSAIAKIMETVADLKQQRDLIELALQQKNAPCFSREKYQARSEELKEIRQQQEGVRRTLKIIQEGGLLLADLEDSLVSWAAALHPSLQSEGKEELIAYLEHYSHLLSMQETVAQQQLSLEQDLPSELTGIDLKTAQSLCVSYNQKLDECNAAMRHFSNLRQEILAEEFEISSLSPVLGDSFSLRLIEEASRLCLRMKDERNRTAKEDVRWREELSLQKKILSDHLDQLFKVEHVKSELIQEKMNALQRLSLKCMIAQISVLTEQFVDSIKERKKVLSLKKQSFEKKIKELQKSFETVPERWFKEKSIDLKTKMGIQMVQGLSELIESKTIGNHLHHIESKPLDRATLPDTPCKPGLLTMAILGAFLSGFVVFVRSFFMTLVKGFPSSIDKLRAMGLLVLGEISFLSDGPNCHPLEGADLEMLRQVSFFLDRVPGRVVGLLANKGPDYSYALGAHLAQMSRRSFILRCDFSAKFHSRDVPGLLQFWTGEVQELPLRKEKGYDFIPSGGFTPFGSEMVRSKQFAALLDQLKQEYECIFLLIRSPLDTVESKALCDLCDKMIVTLAEEPTEQLTPFIDWAYDKEVCRLAFLTVHAKGSKS